MRASIVILALSSVLGCSAHKMAATRGRLFQAPLPPLRTRREAHPAPATFNVAQYLEASPNNMEDIVSEAKKLYVDPKGLGRNCNPRNGVPKNVAAGFLVALTMVPQAVAFSLIAGVSPLTGLWTSAIMGFFSTIFGGRPGSISTASGACALVMAPLVANYGVWYMPGVVMLAGLLQMGAGFGKLGKYVEQAPKPVMFGIVNGLALLMAQAQLKHFHTATGAWMVGHDLFVMGGLTTITYALMYLLPRLSTALPTSFLSVLITTGISTGCALPAKTLADLAGAKTFLAGGLSTLPALSFPALDWLAPATWAVVLPFAVTLAAVGLIESILTLNVVDGMTGYGKRGNQKKECIGQGIGNFAASLAGGMGGGANIGQSVINLNNGGNSRLSGISMSVFLAAGVLFGAPLLAKVPIAALVGVLLAFSQRTFTWSSVNLWRRLPKIDFITLGLVSAVTLVKDVAAGALVGIAATAITHFIKKRLGEDAPKYGPYDGPIACPDPTSSYLENLNWQKA